MRFEKLLRSMESKYDNPDPGNPKDPSHDFAHIRRVLDSCQRIGQAVGANLGILLPAGLLHDVVNVPKNSPDRALASRKAASMAAEILREFGYTDAEIQQIAVVIVEHSFSLGMKPSTLESAVLQDADRLDAVGAIGLMRTVSCGARFGAAYYHPEEPIPSSRALDDKKYTIDHLYVKLFKLADLMNTEAGKTEARRRTQFMQDFVRQLQTEIR